MELGARRLADRRMQPGDQVMSRQAGPMTAKSLARDPLHQIARMRALGELFGHHHAQTGGFALVRAVMEDVKATTQRAPKSKNG